MIFDRQADIFRLLSDPNDADNNYYQRVYSNFKINIQPESAENTAFVGGTFGRTYRAFVSQSGIRIHDRIALSGTTTLSGMEFTVRGVLDWNFAPLPHYEIILEEA